MSSRQILTLISSPTQVKLSASLVSKVHAALEAQKIKVTGREMLSEDEAWDLFVTHTDAESIEAIARETLQDEPIDCIAQSVAGRRKQLLISDMDSTIITIECIDEIADFAGVKDKVAVITERAMNGELDFKEALTERVMLLKDLSESVLQQVYDERVTFMPGAKQLLSTMKFNGAYCLLVSGGFDFFTSRVRDALGFDADSSNLLEIENGLLTGRVIPPILDKDAKLASLLAAANEKHIPLYETLALGDGANDLPMLLAAGLGMAYHAKPTVRAAARARLDHCDLTGVLFAQGYKREEFLG